MTAGDMDIFPWHYSPYLSFVLPCIEVYTEVSFPHTIKRTVGLIWIITGLNITTKSEYTSKRFYI
jgi:hypothetical protein